jgi:hypothetical protein
VPERKKKTSKKEESDAKERERKFQGRKMGSQDNLTFVPLAVRRWWNTRFPDGPHVKNDNFCASASFYPGWPIRSLPSVRAQALAPVGF